MIRQSCALLFLLWLSLVQTTTADAGYDSQPNEADALLIEAVKKDNPEIVLVALQRGADPSLTHERRGTFLHQAKSTEVAQILIKRNLDINARDAKGRTPLLRAVDKGNSDLARFYLENGADPELLEESEPRSLMHIAAEEGDLGTVTLLLEYGIEADEADEMFVTPLHLAVVEGHEAVVTLLLEEKADPNALTNNMTSPAHIAKTAEILKLLINAGADINSRNERGATPLHFAVAKKRSKILAILLRNGADPNAPLDDGTSALELLDQDQLAIFRLLSEYGGFYNTNEKGI